MNAQATEFKVLQHVQFNACLWKTSEAAQVARKLCDFLVNNVVMSQAACTCCVFHWANRTFEKLHVVIPNKVGFLVALIRWFKSLLFLSNSFRFPFNVPSFCFDVRLVFTNKYNVVVRCDFGFFRGFVMWSLAKNRVVFSCFFPEIVSSC